MTRSEWQADQLGGAAQIPSSRIRRDIEIPGERGRVAAIPRLALTPPEAAAALGIGLTSFKKYVQPDVRIVRRGKLRVIPVRELERWADENADRVLEAEPERSFSDLGHR